MGHYCRICGRSKPNEKFSGKGHKNHICKECSKLPKDEIATTEHMDEIFNYLSQSNISSKNVGRLTKLSKSSVPEVAEHAAIVLEVAKVKPHKKRRLKYLAKNHRSLLYKLEETGLIFAHHH